MQLGFFVIAMSMVFFTPVRCDVGPWSYGYIKVI